MSQNNIVAHELQNLAIAALEIAEQLEPRTSADQIPAALPRNQVPSLNSNEIWFTRPVQHRETEPEDLETTPEPLRFEAGRAKVMADRIEKAQAAALEIQRRQGPAHLAPASANELAPALGLAPALAPAPVNEFLSQGSQLPADLAGDSDEDEYIRGSLTVPLKNKNAAYVKPFADLLEKNKKEDLKRRGLEHLATASASASSSAPAPASSSASGPSMIPKKKTKKKRFNVDDMTREEIHEIAWAHINKTFRQATGGLALDGDDYVDDDDKEVVSTRGKSHGKTRPPPALLEAPGLSRTKAAEKAAKVAADKEKKVKEKEEKERKEKREKEKKDKKDKENEAVLKAAATDDSTSVARHRMEVRRSDDYHKLPETERKAYMLNAVKVFMAERKQAGLSRAAKVEELAAAGWISEKAQAHNVGHFGAGQHLSPL